MRGSRTARPRQFVQPGLGTTETKTGGELRSMWIEIPAWCDLYCQYCFAATRKIDRDPNNLAPEEYRRLIREFAEMGGRELGIPGAGEPFHEDPKLGVEVSNRRLTMEILDVCKGLGIGLTVFTTGHWIDAELADRLLGYDVVLLIKYNSMHADIQNTLVGCPGGFDYALRRDHALLMLMAKGFNEPGFGKNSRLGIVTSVMNANKGELPALLRFARRHNLIFDCDTILERGRGKSFDDQGGSPPENEMRGVFRQLQQIDAQEFNNHWHISRSYVGTCCDRFRHHLYVSKTGNVSPCVGATTVDLGNFRKSSLKQCWDAPAMKIIRSHQYKGKCTQCRNYAEKRCYSCLGRCTTDLTATSIVQYGCVMTTGCWNHLPKPRTPQGG